MKAQQRNTFLVGMSVLALIALAAILVASPNQKKPDEALVKTIRFGQPTTAGVVNREVLLVKIQTDVVAGARFSSGKTSAKVTMTEFADFQCSLCGAYFQTAETFIQSEFVETGKLQLFWRDMPLPQHQHARISARFGACAEDQGQFEAMKKMLFDSQRDWSKIYPEKIQADLLGRSRGLDLDQAALKSCIQSTKHDAAIQADYDMGIQLELEGTPSFIINGYKFAGALPIEGFRAIFKEFGLE